MFTEAESNYLYERNEWTRYTGSSACPRATDKRGDIPGRLHQAGPGELFSCPLPLRRSAGDFSRGRFSPHRGRTLVRRCTACILCPIYKSKKIAIVEVAEPVRPVNIGQG